MGGEILEDHCRIWVRDNGLGIDPEELPYIFNRFYWGKNVCAEGSGLGLAMVKSVAEAHGGSVSAESELGVGSTLTIQLPLTRTS